MNRLPVLDPTKALFLKTIATTDNVTRVELSHISGLTKATVSAVVSALIDCGYVAEKTMEVGSRRYAGMGRRPTVLLLSEASPLICGMLVRRGCLSVTLSGLDGKIFKILEYAYESITADAITEILAGMFFKLRAETGRTVLGIGLACLGPIDLESRSILKPHHFYGIENYAIAAEIEAKTALPVWMQNDINAAAVAEALWGSGKSIENFIYLHLMNGIGTGTILGGMLYTGNSGNAGDIGHMTVNMFGEACTCGSTGCLECYANIGRIRTHMARISGKDTADLSFRQVISLLNRGDLVARSAMQEYISVLAVALSGMLRCLDIQMLIFGYDGSDGSEILEDMLEQELRRRMANSGQHAIRVKKSAFFSDAPLIGATAIVADRFFGNQ